MAEPAPEVTQRRTRLALAMAARARACVSARPAATEPRLGVLSYQALDFPRVSGNLGDPVQTLAFLTQLARNTQV